MGLTWEQRKAKELCSIGTGKSNTQDQVEDGIYPFYIRSDIPVNSNKYLYDCEAVITIGDGNIGRVFHYVNGKFDLHQRCYKMTDFQNVWGKYFYYFFSTRFYDRAMKMTAKATVDSVRLEMISEMNILKPTEINEQKKIADFFTYLDNLITLHQREYEKLTNVKKSMLEKMFPKNGSNVPEIRFKGFTEAWEQCKLGEIYQVNNERNEGQYPVEKTLSIATMTFNQQGNGADDSSLSKYKVLRVGDLAFEGHTNREFRYGRFVLNNLENGIMSPRFTTLRPIIEQDFSFWEYYIHSERIMRSKLVNATKAGTMMNELVPEDLFKQMILMPAILEQHKIGEFFKHLDNLITLHQRK